MPHGCRGERPPRLSRRLARGGALWAWDGRKIAAGDATGGGLEPRRFPRIRVRSAQIRSNRAARTPRACVSSIPAVPFLLAEKYLIAMSSTQVVPHCQVYANQEARISEIRPMHGKSRPDRIWRCGRGRRWRVVGGFSRDGDDEWRGWGWQAARGCARNGGAGGRDARSADEAARSKPRPLLPRWASGAAWLGCGNEERSGVNRRVDA